jgi:uncharacterized repeat protein (TIGR03803 family)
MIDHEEKSVMSKITPAKIEEQTPQAISRTRSNPLPALVSMIGLLGLMAVSRPQPSDAAEQVLYSFCSQGGTNCTDGNFPNSGLIMDASGNLYGTTYGGGAHGHGVVFELSPGAAAPTILYSFCAQGGSSCTDGNTPDDLIMDASGNLYGTTVSGGAHGQGVVYELAKTNGGYASAPTILYNFCAQTNCSDGADPYNLVMDTSGNLFGIASGGAAGMIFELAKTNGGYAGAPTILYNFCAPKNCPDGGFLGNNLWPYTSTVLIIDASGNLYGAMPKGGVNGQGTVFELAKTTGGYSNALTILYSFCSQGGSSCTDGAVPTALLLDPSGNLYGTTWSGGTTASAQPYGVGTVFELIRGTVDRPFPHTTWSPKVLYSFCSVMVGAQCTDGSFPAGGLIMDNCRNLYGTASGQGSFENGVVFELTPIWDRTWKETPLHTFCFQENNCTDGKFPRTGVIADKSGNLYGTTQWGGANGEVSPNSPAGQLQGGFGTVFEMSP